MKKARLLSLFLAGMTACFLGHLRAETTSVPTNSAPNLPMVSAAIQVVGGSMIKLTPNELGSFPRVIVPANGSVAVTVTYNGGAAGEPAYQGPGQRGCLQLHL